MEDTQTAARPKSLAERDAQRIAQAKEEADAKQLADTEAAEAEQAEVDKRNAELAAKQAEFDAHPYSRVGAILKHLQDPHLDMHDRIGAVHRGLVQLAQIVQGTLDAPAPLEPPAPVETPDERERRNEGRRYAEGADEQVPARGRQQSAPSQRQRE